MTENVDLDERREELQLILREDHTKTLVDVMMDWAARPFRKVIDNDPALSFLFGTLAIYLLAMLAGTTLIVILGEFRQLDQLVSRFSWWFFLVFITTTLSMTGANAFIHRIVAVFRDDILQIAETNETLDEIEKWVVLVRNKKLTLLLGVLGSVVASAVFLPGLSAYIGSLVGIGQTVTFFLFSMQSSLFVFFLYAILFLTVRMHRFHLALFPSDPGNSQVIGVLSRLMSSFVYLFALYGAALTYGIVVWGLTSIYQFWLVFWVLIVLIFAANQYSLAKIIQRVKWQTLNSIQTQIQKIQKDQAILDIDARESLVWLFDYYDRVKATRNSALNLDAGVNLFSSLLLPLLAFVLGNMDIVSALFR